MYIMCLVGAWQVGENIDVDIIASNANAETLFRLENIENL